MAPPPSGGQREVASAAASRICKTWVEVLIKGEGCRPAKQSLWAGLMKSPSASSSSSFLQVNFVFTSGFVLNGLDCAFQRRLSY